MRQKNMPAFWNREWIHESLSRQIKKIIMYIFKQWEFHWSKLCEMQNVMYNLKQWRTYWSQPRNKTVNAKNQLTSRQKIYESSIAVIEIMSGQPSVLFLSKFDDSTHFFPPFRRCPYI